MIRLPRFCVCDCMHSMLPADCVLQFTFEQFSARGNTKIPISLYLEWPAMGSKKQFLVQSLKRAAALASVLGVLGGISAGAVSAQTARYQPLNQQSQRAALGTPLRSGAAPPIPTSYSRIPSQNSVRIVGAQPATPPRSTQQATVNRRALIGRGRMISAGYPQDSAVAPGPGGLPQDSDQSVLQRDDKQTPGIFQ